MKLTGLRGSINYLFEWVVTLAWLNTLWLLFTIGGMVLFGWAPATIAMLTVLRKIYHEKNFDVAMFKTFLHAFKANFITANGLSLVFLLVFGFIGSGMLTLRYLPSSLFIVMSILYTIIISLLFIVFLFVFPAFTHYQTTFINYFKYALLIGLAHFHYALFMILVFVLTYFLFSAFPGLLLFFAVSIPGALMMKLALTVFTRVDVYQASAN
ncbi:Uncharacterized membrane protein YesL [Amphibacillus marinus]|uniref:Uncharacterized membrane protein YesL n=1 Tax=Amphibacillus marinus TaxID=872970 RepID=A0A1H8H3N0_9BACI|nr:DUF624 domain-containing protein [Amphibacillus marinus]SEN50863.1 Uncharacterized membrane protein YesL [Amphibacillus marinus]